MASSYQVKISLHAQQQLENIYINGFKKWGEKQADIYYDMLIKHISELSISPLIYQEVNDVRQGYRRRVCGKHTIYYRINGKVVEVMAVIGKQAPYNYF